MNKNLYLHLEPHMISPESGATVQVKLDDEGIVAEAWSLDDCIATTNKTASLYLHFRSQRNKLRMYV